jgi:dTDP-4-amino-4,6-dideoxygalactose transaminase
VSESFKMPVRQYATGEFWRRRGGGDPLERNGARVYRFAQGRYAIHQGLAALGVGPGDRVLVPSYLCIAAVEAVTALGAVVDFHDVGDDGRVDVSVIESAIGPDTRAVLCVHYFGFPQPVAALRQLCDRRGIALVEDCAHVLPRGLGADEPGRVGDLAVFSWSKVLPVNDGASLVVNRGAPPIEPPSAREALPETLQSVKDMWDRSVAWADWPTVRAVYRWLERPKALLRGGRLGATARSRDEDGAWFEPSRTAVPMSRLARWVLAHSDLEAIRRRRREHYQYLADRIARLDGVTTMAPALDPDVCPWIYPLRFDARPRAHLELRAMGIPAVAWEGVRPEGIRPDRFPRADFLYDNLIMLPVHQSLRPRDLDLIVDAVEQVARAARTA